MIKEIKQNGKVFAVLIDNKKIKEGTMPISDISWPIQILMMNRRKGHVVPKHMHKRIYKRTKQPQEAIVVTKGSILASIFDRKGKIIAKKKVSAGQCLLIVDGGHEVKITNNALIYEFKNGPYIDDKIML